MLYIIYEYFSPAYKAGGPIQSLQNLVSYISPHIPTSVICNNHDLGGEKLNVVSDSWVKHGQSRVFYSSKGFNNYSSFLKQPGAVVFINGVYSIQYSFLPALFFSGRKIISVRGMLHADARSQKALKKKIYLSVWKLLSLHRKCEYHATSEAEKNEIIRSFGAKTKVWVAQNLPKQLNYADLPEKPVGKLVMTTIALISPMKNHYLVLEALKLCTSTIVYNIYGPVKDPSYWQKCLQLIDQLPGNVKVIYHGDVLPAKVEGTLSQAHVYIQPSKSENFGHSIFEALSIGRPVITSNNTPWNGLENAHAGMNIQPSNATDISNAVEFFAKMDRESLKLWSKSAAGYATSSVNIEGIGAKYLEMFSSNSINNSTN